MRRGRGYGSLALLMLFVGVGPCQAQVVMETAVQEEDEGAGGVLKKALLADLQRKSLAAASAASACRQTLQTALQQLEQLEQLQEELSGEVAALQDGESGGSEGGGHSTWFDNSKGKIANKSSVEEELSGEVAALQDENAEKRKVEVVPLVEEDTARGLTAPFGKIVTESSLEEEELSGEVAALQEENAEKQVPLVEEDTARGWTAPFGNVTERKLQDGEGGVSEGGGHSTWFDSPKGRIVNESSAGEELSGEAAASQEENAEKQVPLVEEDTARGLTAPFGKIVTESSLEEKELSGEVAALQEENAEEQKVEMSPLVEEEENAEEQKVEVAPLVEEEDTVFRGLTALFGSMVTGSSVEEEVLRGEVAGVQEENAEEQKVEMVPLVEEDTARGLTAPFGKVVTESSQDEEELSGEAEMLPPVEMERSVSEEDTPAQFEDSPVPFGWGRPQAELRDLSAAVETSTTETSTTMTTTTVTTTTVTTVTTVTETTTTVTTTTPEGGNAPAPSPNVYTTEVSYSASYETPPDQATLDATCDAFRVTVADQTGVPVEDVTCEASYSNGTITADAETPGGRRLTGQGTASFDVTLVTKSVDEAAQVTSTVAAAEPAAITAAVQTVILNDPTVPEEVKAIAQTVAVEAIEDVVTQRQTKVRAMRGELTVTVGNTEYTSQEVISFATDMLVQALADVPNTNVHADNITLSVDTSTSIRFTITSFEAIEDLSILEALSQPDIETTLQTILTDAGAAITIDGVTVEWEISGTLTIASNATSATDQQKLTDASVFIVTSATSSLSTYAQTQFGLLPIQVGVFLEDQVGYEEGVNTSNRIVVTYSYVPTTRAEYCDIAALQTTEAQLSLMEAALSYEGIDPSIQPILDSIDQDPVLAACGLTIEEPTDDETSTATAVIVVIVIGVLLVVVGIVFAAWFVWRRSRTADASSGPLTGDAGEEQSHGAVHGRIPASNVQVRLPPTDQNGAMGQSAEAPASDVHRERGADRHGDPNHGDGEEQFLEYLDDEPSVDAV